MQFLWRWWFGNVDVVILDCDHSSMTQRSQIKVASFVDFSMSIDEFDEGGRYMEKYSIQDFFAKQKRVQTIHHCQSYSIILTIEPTE